MGSESRTYTLPGKCVKKNAGLLCALLIEPRNKCYYYECAECLSNIDCGFDEVSDNTILSDFNSMFSSIAHQPAIHAGLGMIETAAGQESAY